MGRPRKPTELKKLQGTAQPCRLNPDEPTPEIGMPDVPKGLAGDALEIYAELGGALQRMRVLTTEDGRALEGAARAIADRQEAQAKVDELGVLLIEEQADKEGNVYGHKYKANPAVAARNDADRRLLNWLSQLGMTPATRSKVSVVKGPKKETGFAATRRKETIN